jgi:hypothetical protein
MPSKNLISNELEFTPTFGTQQVNECGAGKSRVHKALINI